MIRVAAHKLGSISSSPQSATVLTILTQPTDRQGLLHSLQLFHWLSNWRLFTWLLIHSILPTPQPTHLPPNCTEQRHPSNPNTASKEINLWYVHASITHIQFVDRGNKGLKRNPVRSENEVCVGFTGLPWDREMRRPWCVSDVIARKHSGSQSISQLWHIWGFSLAHHMWKCNTCLCINCRHVENVQIHTLTTCLSTCTALARQVL